MSLSIRTLCHSLVPVLLWSCQSTENRSIRASELPAPPSATVQPSDDGRVPAATAPAPVDLASRDMENVLPPTVQAEDEWEFVFTPYAWLLSVDGSANIKGQESIVDESFSDIWDTLNLVVEGKFEARKGPWAAIVDFTYAEMEVDAELGSIDIETQTDMTLVFGGAMYRFIDQPRVAEQGGLTVDGFFGIAYTSLDVDLEVSGGPDASGGESWVDPMIGLRSHWYFSEKWGASLESLIGGFDLFDGSDLVTMNTAVMSRHYGPYKTLFFGWRTLDIDYDNDESGSDEFAMNVNINGPIIGFGFRF